jgi:hypothetical protein
MTLIHLTTVLAVIHSVWVTNSNNVTESTINRIRVLTEGKMVTGLQTQQPMLLLY